MYSAIVLSTFLYGTETWTVYKADCQEIHIFMMHHLHKILNVKSWQHILKKLIPEKSNLAGLYKPNTT